MQSNTESKPAELPVVEIETTAGTQARATDENRSASAARQYMQDMRENIYFDPIDVFAEKGSKRYILGHGFHRLRGRIDAGFQTIECRVHEGGVRDAKQFSIESNHTHGLPRSKADKRKAVNMTLDDLEWGQLGNRAIARMCGVSHTFVAKVREDRNVGNRDGKQRENKATSTQALNEAKAASGGVGGNVATHEPADPKPADLNRRAPRTQRQVNRDDTIEGANQLTTSWPGSIENLAEFDGYANVSLMRRARVVAGEYIKSYMKQQSEAA